MKEKKRKFVIALGLVLNLSMFGVSRATLVELPLDCAGIYDRDNYWETNFNLGVEFTDISHVYIDCEGEIIGGRAIKYINPNNPFTVDVGIYASLGFNPSLRRITLWGGSEKYPDPEPFDCTIEFELYGGSTWSDLLDGKGTIRVGYTELIISDGTYIESGKIDLDNIKLVLEGTEIPEPSSIILLSLGVGCLRIRIRKRYIF